MGDAPQLLNTSYTITAELEIPEPRLGLGAPQAGDGMIATQGGRFAGWGFYVLKGRPVYVWNLLGQKRVRWEGEEPLSAGQHTLEFDFKYDGLGFGTLAFNNLSGIGRAGTRVLKVDGKVVCSGTKHSTLAPILGRLWTTGTTRSRSASPANSTK